MPFCFGSIKYVHTIALDTSVVNKYYFVFNKVFYICERWTKNV
nr:MAG TPA: hypothetical protein [Caudoviricetes sp.]